MKKILLGSLILLAAAACNFQLSQNTKTPLGNSNNSAQSQQAAAPAQQTPAPTDNSTSGWKVFTNSKYNFTFQYPQEFIAQPSSAPQNDQVIDLGDFQNGQEFLSVSILNSKFDPAQEAAYADAKKVSLGGQEAYQYLGNGDGPCTSVAVDTALPGSANQTLSLSWGACEAAPQNYVMTSENVTKIQASFKFTK